MSARLPRSATHGARADEARGQHAQVVRRPAVEGRDDEGGGGRRRGRSVAAGLGEKPPGLALEGALEEALRPPLALDEVVLRLLRDGHEIVEWGGERRHEAVEHALPPGDGGERAVAAHERDPRAALVALQRRDHDDADLGRRAGVRPPAGLPVEAVHFDDAHVGLDSLGRLQALRAGLGRREHRHPHGTRFPHHLVGAALRRARLLLADEAVEVDGRDLAAEVEGDRLGLGDLDERLRQQVLAVVLLHVVAPAVRVDDPVHTLGGQRSIEHVEDVLSFLDHGDDARVAERAGVPRLPAALGVEGGPVEDHGGPALVIAPRDHRRVELEEIGVGGVEALGHGRDGASEGRGTRHSGTRSLRRGPEAGGTPGQGRT